MKFNSSALIVGLLASLSSASPHNIEKRLSNSLGKSLGIKTNSMISYDKVYFGFAPNWDKSITMAQLNQATGQEAATYNVYSQITSKHVNAGSYNGNSQYNVNDIINSKAVLIASLMPEVEWSKITPALCDSIADYYANKFTKKGVTVWLRFAHEMNWYASSGDKRYPGGQDYPTFKKAWKNMFNAIKGNDKIFMYWSPNIETSETPIAPWWPGKDTVDIVGLDLYPTLKSQADTAIPTFADAYGKFYNTYAKGYGLPFAIGETGIRIKGGKSASVAQREQWLKNIINPSGGFGDYSKYYVGCTWFEYGPPINDEEYYVVWGQSLDTVKKTISNTVRGS